MTAPPAPLGATKRSTALAGVCLAAAVYMAQYLYRLRYAPGRYNEEGWAGNANWWEHRGVLQAHFVAAFAVLVAMPFQVWKYARDRHRRAHRLVGRAFFVVVFASMCGAAFFAFYKPSTAARTREGTWWVAFQFQQVLAFTLLTSGMAWLRARQRRFADHRRWVFRLVSLLWSGVSQRVVFFNVFPLEWAFRYPLYVDAVTWVVSMTQLVALEWYLSFETARKEPRRRQQPPQAEELLLPPAAGAAPAAAGGRGTAAFAAFAAAASAAVACAPSFWPARPGLVAHGALGLAAAVAVAVAARRPGSAAATPAAGLLGLAAALAGAYYAFVSPPRAPSGEPYMEPWSQRAFLAQGVQCWCVFAAAASAALLWRHAQGHAADRRRWLLRVAVLLAAEAARFVTRRWLVPAGAWTDTAFLAVSNSAWALPTLALEWGVLSRETAAGERAAVAHE